jgi:nitrogen regulatory protein PII
MKKVEAIIAPFALDTLKRLLVRRGCEEIAVSEVRGSYSGIGCALRYRGNEYLRDSASIKIETVVEDEEAMPTVEAILHASSESSNAGHQITVCPLEQVISVGISKVELYEPGYHEHRA